MKIAPKFFKENYPYTDEAMKHDHPMWHDCVTQAMESYAKERAVECTMKYYNYSALKKNAHPNVLKEHVTECYNIWYDKFLKTKQS